MTENSRHEIKTAFDYYKAHQIEIVSDHIDEFVVIKGQKVCGYYENEEDAFDSMIGEDLETFIVQKCQEPGTDIANYYNNAVAFA